MKKSIEKI